MKAFVAYGFTPATSEVELQARPWIMSSHYIISRIILEHLLIASAISQAGSAERILKQGRRDEKGGVRLGEFKDEPFSHKGEMVLGV